MALAMFYHLTRSPLEVTLPVLLARSLKAGWRVVVRGRDEALLGRLDQRLWTDAEESFLPHGMAGGPHDAAQPILLTTGPELPNRPEVVKGFVGAVLHAIRDIEADPAQAAKEYVGFVPQHSGKEAQIEAVLKAYSALIYPEAEGQPLGTFDPARIEAVQKFYVDAGIVQTAVPVGELYSNDFAQ